MQGYRIHSWGGDPVWEEFGRPVPGHGEVLVEVEACGVGLTVLNYIRGDLASDPELLPRVPGHEIIGRVIDAGPGEATALVGERVAAYFYLVCGRCRPCLAQAEPRCEHLAGWVGVHRDGGYAPFAVLPAMNAVPIPAHLGAAEATVIPDAVATALHVCTRRARIRPGERVAVVGAAGGVGIHAVQVARLCGGTVIGLDIGDAKLEALDALGIEPLESRDFDALTSSWRGRPADVIVDLLGSEGCSRGPRELSRRAGGSCSSRRSGPPRCGSSLGRSSWGSRRSWGRSTRRGQSLPSPPIWWRRAE
jgi:D-arabinose 1-dehydrogenase-like Zn-dependent alcohol dehydrogenase